MTIPAGYSGTPLAKKLGITPQIKYLVINAPQEFRDWLGDLPTNAQVVQLASPPLVAAHMFVLEKEELTLLLTNYRDKLAPAGFIWVSWPKKASKITTDITEDVIRAVALPLGYVDIKVCAVSAVWSGLKLVIRKELRGG